MKWLPNTLSISRIILAFPIALLAYKQNWVWAFVLLITGCFTDFIDGIIAKKINAQTDFGKKILDPICDAFLAGGAMFGLGLQGNIGHNFLIWGVPVLIL